jgi:hypothetical protein
MAASFLLYLGGRKIFTTEDTEVHRNAQGKLKGTLL